MEMIMVGSELEGDFYAFMHSLDQVDETLNREALAYYVSFFAQCSCVLDVGCGEGQFIELLQAEGVEAVGIDRDARMVETCREKGLNVVLADLFDYLPQHEGQFDGIFSSNLIEHLARKDAIRFIERAFKALPIGGRLLIATPNPASPIVHLYEFWRDATHIRLYNDSLLEFLFHWAGFETIESGENPRTSWTRYPLTGDELSGTWPCRRWQSQCSRLRCPRGDDWFFPFEDAWPAFWRRQSCLRSLQH
jgi:SAM-dependent methyltransferase